MLYNYGREDSLGIDGLRRLAQSINRYLGNAEESMDEADRDATPLHFIASRLFRGIWFLDRLWDKLGIKGALNTLLKQRNFTMPVKRAIFAMVANRALAPSGKLAVEQWVAEDVHIEGLTEIEVQNLYGPWICYLQ